ncbi:MAG: glycosyltransferase [Patescibacteria group bacterium]
MNVKFYMVDTHACGYYRGEIVAREVNGQYPNHRMDCKTCILFSDYPGTHLMVFQRQNKNLESVQFARARGIATIYELDDDIWGCPPVFEAYGKRCLKPEESEAIMRECDAITVTTPELGEVVREHLESMGVRECGSMGVAADTPLRQHTPTVYVVPNAIDLEMWDAAYGEKQVGNRDPGSPPPATGETMTIGWMASQSHLMDVPLVGEVLRDLLAEFPQLRLHFVGWIGMESFMGNMMAPFKDRIVCGDWVPVSQLAETMKGFDIGLLPLVDHPWNRSKSELKYLQYSALGIPTVASPLPCYARAIESGAGLVAEHNAPAAWYNHLKALILDEGLRRGMGARARRNVYLKHNIKDQVRVWVETYERVRAGK